MTLALFHIEFRSFVRLKVHQDLNLCEIQDDKRKIWVCIWQKVHRKVEKPLSHQEHLVELEKFSSHCSPSPQMNISIDVSKFSEFLKR